MLLLHPVQTSADAGPIILYIYSCLGRCTSVRVVTISPSGILSRGHLLHSTRYVQYSTPCSTHHEHIRILRLETLVTCVCV